MTVSDQLRMAIKRADATLYRVAKDADVDWGMLRYFLDRTRPDIRISTVDKLCEHLGLELLPKKKRSEKQPRRPPGAPRSAQD
jgi:hypothetical protein